MAVRGQAETRIKVGAAGAAGLLLFLALVSTSKYQKNRKKSGLLSNLVSTRAVLEKIEKKSLIFCQTW